MRYFTYYVKKLFYENLKTRHRKYRINYDYKFIYRIYLSILVIILFISILQPRYIPKMIDDLIKCQRHKKTKQNIIMNINRTPNQMLSHTSLK